MRCQFCGREISNKGSLKSHEMCCKSNPDRIAHKRSPNAGAKKGRISWNTGLTFMDENIQRSVLFFETGKHTEASESTSRKHAKRILIHEKGNVCEICGTSEWMGQSVPLVCDHVSGDSTDNKFENFRLVCCNCDAQLPTYKSKNRGRGRQYDRNRYRRKANPIGDGTCLENS